MTTDNAETPYALKLVNIPPPPAYWSIGCGLCKELAASNDRCQKCRALRDQLTTNPTGTLNKIAAQLGIAPGDVSAGLTGTLPQPTATTSQTAEFVALHVDPPTSV